MSRRLLTLVLLSACILAYRGTELWMLLSGIPRPSALGSLDVRDGRLVVGRVGPLDADGAPNPAIRMGIKPGDRLAAFEAPDGRRFEIDSLNAYGQAIRYIGPREGWVLEIDREESGQSMRLRLPGHAASRGWLGLTSVIFMSGLLPVLTIATSLLIGWLRPDDGRAFLAGLLFLGLSSLFGSSEWALPPVMREVAAVVQTVLSTSFPYLFMRFFLVFPSPSPIDRRMPWLKHVLLAPVAALAVASFVVNESLAHSLAVGSRAMDVLRNASIETAYIPLVLGMFAIGLVSGVWQVFRADTPGDRRRLSILLGGTILGLLPFFGALAYIVATGTGILPVWLIPLVICTLPIFPLSFIYVVVRHRVLGVSVIVRRGVQYALVSRGVLVLEGVLVFLALYLVLGPLLQVWIPMASAGGIATTNAVVAIGAVVGLGRVNRRVHTAIDRRFFREPYNAQQVLADLGGALQRAATDRASIAGALARSLAPALHAATIDVVFGQDRLVTAASIRVDAGTGVAEERTAGGGPVDADVARVLADLAESHDGADVLEIDSPADLRTLGQRLSGGLRQASQTRALLGTLEQRGVRVIAPLQTHSTQLGWVLLGDKLSEEAYTPEDRELVRAAVQQAAFALDYTALIRKVADQEGLKRELDIARQVQAGLLPQRRPGVVSLEYDGVCRMAREVGGDYFDFIDVGNGDLGVAVGDISGKGVSAALLMASLQALLRSRARLLRNDPATLMTELNRALFESTDPSKFATLFFAVFDSRARTLLYVNAGHNPPFVCKAGGSGLLRLDPTGMALGFDEGARYEASTVRLAPGDTVLIYTDGITEAFSASDREYGEARLAELIQSNSSLPPDALMKRLLDDVDSFSAGVPQHDDMTIVAATVR